MKLSSSTETFSSGDVSLAYRRFGTASQDAGVAKTPVVFVHGLSYFSYDWLDFGRRLCSDREGCAIDMRGFGDSTWSQSKDYSIPTMADDIGRLLGHLNWRQVILMAHSMGGRSASYFAANAPESVRGLVLVDWSPENAAAGSKRVANTVASAPEAFESIDAAMHYFGSDPDSPEGKNKRARFEAYLRPVGNGFEVKRDLYFRDQFRQQLETGKPPNRGVDLWKTVEMLATPTLVIRATRSDLFAPETLPKMLKSNDLIRAEEIEGGHNVVGDNPDASLKVIRKFIDSLETK